ncbi:MULTISPECIES: N-acetylmuramic acid 6-phosphate etherase [Arthrobacter]|uniref:N-acetylmuramic acid 6-phosphate etherase n=2 Tax=Arthrobacter TaxID=1663 RepID=A0ABU9KL80_9MICC|nr:N-acetylmuramic acid 6-phosphate etherase [Arthrobacter sp. YJM1]MDP5227661.1 N-acetylmuramic acid 6-phosphate etherase [Arthrobacter sp. YJM1]
MTSQPDPTDTLAELRRQLAGLSTEAANPELSGIDSMSTAELVRAMNGQDVLVAPAVGRCLDAVAAAVDGVYAKLAAGGRLIYTGAGTAGRVGVLDASECPPTYGTDPDLVVGVIAGGARAIREAVENAEDDAVAGAADLAALNIGPGDAVVGISASGRTPYVVGALESARAAGAFTVALACNTGSAIGAAAEVAIEVEVGPEFVAGSTRLKSGTAQKLVINMISTLSMVKLGKTYGNMMVDLQATNAKLRARSQRTVQQATGVGAPEAAQALDAADGSVKLAILMILTGLDAAAGRAALDASGGYLRQAVQQVSGS